MNIKRILAFILSVCIAVSMFSVSVLFTGAQSKDEVKYVSAQLPGLESLSNVQLALVSRENVLRVRTSSAQHEDDTEKSLEITITAPENGEYESFSIASVTSVGKNVGGFENAAHDFPRGGEVFGGVSLEGTEKLSFWLGNYPANGKVKIQLLTAPCSGLSSAADGYSDYTRGFIFESKEVSPVDGVVTFDFEDFTPASMWTEGKLLDYISEVNAIRVILIPGSGNAAYNTKFYMDDMRIWRKAYDYKFAVGNGIIRGDYSLKVITGFEDAKLSVDINGERLNSLDSAKNMFGETEISFGVDTSKYPDGRLDIKLYDGDNEVAQTVVMVDNKEPYLNTLGEDMLYGVTLTEHGGNIIIPAIMSEDEREYAFYQGELLPVEAKENQSSLADMKERDPEGETALSEAVDGYYSTVSNTTAVPYQTYEIDATGKTEDITLSYKGKTVRDEALIMQVFKPSANEWVTVAKGDTSGKDNVFSVPVSPADYADENNKIKVRISEYLYGNGSDTFAWTTDTQYYIGYADHILHYMETQFNWLVDEYNNGNIAYVANTGDVVETLLVENQYSLAREVHNILDKANIPNGVTPGNHDVNNAYADQYWTDMAYAMWNKYFGAQYYEHQPWWGGGYLSNTSHYDLITVGGHDLIFLYLGLNHEVTPEGIAWANYILKKYSHRTAIIATHQYVAREGGLLAEPYGYAPQIIENIIEPNPNVRMVICGHEPGAQNLYHEMENGVTVLELLHDYQFTENWGGWQESQGGKGYFRYMTFGEDTVTSRTYSHTFPDVNHFFPEGSRFKENYTMDIEFVPSDREVSTAYFQAIYDVKELGEAVVSENEELWTLSYTGKTDGSVGWFAKTEVDGAESYTTLFPIYEKDDLITFILGDFDEDGNITVSDALAALRIAAELVECSDRDIAIGDIDKDGEITVADALAILRVAARMADSL